MCDARFFYIPTTMRLAVASQKPQFCIRQLSPFMRWLLFLILSRGNLVKSTTCAGPCFGGTHLAPKNGKITFLSLNKFISINYD